MTLLLPKFGKQLSLCYITNSLFGVEYQHWYVTDTKYVIEFGAGEITDAKIDVHDQPKIGGVTESTFARTNEVTERMAKLCGATNYSLALRNCEHAARYVKGK